MQCKSCLYVNGSSRLLCSPVLIHCVKFLPQVLSKMRVEYSWQRHHFEPPGAQWPGPSLEDEGHVKYSTTDFSLCSQIRAWSPPARVTCNLAWVPATVKLHMITSLPVHGTSNVESLSRKLHIFAKPESQTTAASSSSTDKRCKPLATCQQHWRRHVEQIYTMALKLPIIQH